jgi:hypothetical protein
MHLAAGWSFRRRRTVLIGWPPPYPPAEAGHMNADRTVAFVSLAPVAAAQDARGRPAPCGRTPRPRHLARRPRHHLGLRPTRYARPAGSSPRASAVAASHHIDA